MLEMRNLIYLLISGGLHMLVALLFILSSDSSDRIYENIEVTSYVTSIPKTRDIKVQKSQQNLNDKKNQVNLGKAQADIQSEIKNDINNDIQNESFEELASDTSITTPARLLTRAKANRTEAARHADYSGVSKVKLVISSDGSVKEAKLINNLPYGLDDVAIKIARESKFKPAMINNKPVASAILFTVRFESE